MDIFEAIRDRRSVGRTKGDVADADVHKMLEAAVAAPNHKLTQPWRFTVLKIEALAQLGKRLSEIENDPQHAKKMARSPVLIVASYRVDADATRAREDRDATAAAVQNLLLAAHALGYGAIWRTGVYAESPSFAGLIGLPKEEQIVGLIGVGEPDAKIIAQPRSLDGIVRTVSAAEIREGV